MPTTAELIEAIPIIISLIIIEGLLSVDNALAIAAMASHLPGKQKVMALRLGIFGAYFFRFVALFSAQFIIENEWVKLIGAAYLVHLLASHFARKKTGGEHDSLGEQAVKIAGRGFFATVVSIEFMDLTLSVDNVVAAVAMSDKLWVVCTGVFIGILALRLVAGYCIKLIERFPTLEDTAFILIGFVGAILVYQLLAHVHVNAFQKFIGICIILGLSIWYSDSAKVRAVLGPPLRMTLPPMRAYAAVSNVVVNAITWPFRRLWRIVSKST